MIDLCFKTLDSLPVLRKYCTLKILQLFGLFSQGLYRVTLFCGAPSGQGMLTMLEFTFNQLENIATKAKIWPSSANYVFTLSISISTFFKSKQPLFPTPATVIGETNQNRVVVRGDCRQNWNVNRGELVAPFLISSSPIKSLVYELARFSTIWLSKLGASITQICQATRVQGSAEICHLSLTTDDTSYFFRLVSDFIKITDKKPGRRTVRF